MRVTTWICATLIVVVGASIARASDASLFRQSLVDELAALLVEGSTEELSPKQRRACARVIPHFDKFRHFSYAKQASALRRLLRKLARKADGNQAMTGPLVRTTVLLIDRVGLDVMGLKRRLEAGEGGRHARRRARALDEIDDALRRLGIGLGLLLPAVNAVSDETPPLRLALKHVKKAIAATKRAAALVGEDPAPPRESGRSLGPDEWATLTYEVGGHAYTVPVTQVSVSTRVDAFDVYALTILVIGDGTTLLDTKDIVILVPGTSYSPSDVQVVIHGPYGPEPVKLAIVKQCDTASPDICAITIVIEPREPGGPTLTIDLGLREDV